MAATIREKTISIRVSPENYEIIRQTAEREMRTISNFLEYHGLERARVVPASADVAFGSRFFPVPNGSRSECDLL